jgi:hypothetical protein
MVTDWYIAPTALLILLGYIAFDVATHLRKKTVEETGRRVAAISIVFAISATCLSILYGFATNVFPPFDGLPLAAVWFVSLILVLRQEWILYREAQSHSKQIAEVKLDVVKECVGLLDKSLKPLTESIAASQSSVSEFSGKVAKLGEGISGLVATIETQGRRVNEWIQALVAIGEQSEFRESEFKKAMGQYRKWYEERVDAAKVTAELIKSAESVLDEFAVFSDQLDEYLDFFGVGERAAVVRVTGGATVQVQREDQGGPKTPAEGQTAAPQTGGKLTKEAGRANRDKGNKAQLQFTEMVLRPAGKRHEYSLKEGQPDFIFYGPSDNVVKAVGAFKSYTLSEVGTKQRWVARRKLLAEVRTATKYGVPLVFFILNFVNGRIWAKVIGVEELREFNGLTTPLMLIDEDPAAEKTCRETLEMALRLL